MKLNRRFIIASAAAGLVAPLGDFAVTSILAELQSLQAGDERVGHIPKPCRHVD